MLALHSDPLELLVLGVVDELLIRRRGLCEVNSFHRHERDRWTSVAAQALDEDDVIRAKTERGEQTSRGDFGMESRQCGHTSPESARRRPGRSRTSAPYRQAL